MGARPVARPAPGRDSRSHLGRREPGQGHDPRPPLPPAPQVRPRLRRHLGKTPGRCPQRQGTRDATGPVKSKAGRRAIGLPPQLVALLHAHQVEQERERADARQLWRDEGWVFTNQTGQPINPRTDSNEWKRLLRDAGLREARLQDARHTAATVLLVLRQPTPMVMSLMGWSSESMAARYQHVTDALRSEVASQVGDLIWNPAAGIGDQGATLAVGRGSLEAVLAAAELCVTNHGASTVHPAELPAAIADLRAVLMPAPETPNETKTETRRSEQR